MSEILKLSDGRNSIPLLETLISLPVDGGSQYRYPGSQKLKWGHVT